MKRLTGRTGMKKSTRMEMSIFMMEMGKYLVGVGRRRCPCLASG
jgi:hypothetical protein